MQISKNSWHYKTNALWAMGGRLYFFDKDKFSLEAASKVALSAYSGDIPKNLCPYFWKAILGLLLYTLWLFTNLMAFSYHYFFNYPKQWLQCAFLLKQIPNSQEISKIYNEYQAVKGMDLWLRQFLFKRNIFIRQSLLKRVPYIDSLYKRDTLDTKVAEIKRQELTELVKGWNDVEVSYSVSSSFTSLICRVSRAFDLSTSPYNNLGNLLNFDAIFKDKYPEYYFEVNEENIFKLFDELVSTIYKGVNINQKQTPLLNKIAAPLDQLFIETAKFEIFPDKLEKFYSTLYGSSLSRFSDYFYNYRDSRLLEIYGDYYADCPHNQKKLEEYRSGRLKYKPLFYSFDRLYHFRHDITYFFREIALRTYTFADVEIPRASFPLNLKHAVMTEQGSFKDTYLKDKDYKDLKLWNSTSYIPRITLVKNKVSKEKGTPFKEVLSEYIQAKKNKFCPRLDFTE